MKLREHWGYMAKNLHLGIEYPNCRKLSIKILKEARGIKYLTYRGAKKINIFDFSETTKARE